MPTHPPRPRLTLNIGITGHRAQILPAGATTTLRTVIDAVFADLREATGRLHHREGRIFDAAPPQIRLHSPLATGADQLAATIAHGCGFHVRALLPFAPDDYSQDFVEGVEREEFHRQLASADEYFALPGDRSDAEGAYVLVGKAVIAAADILVAIWDGAEGNGPGGTAHVVDLALAASVPVIHVAIDRETATVAAPRLLIGGDVIDPVAEPLADAGGYDDLLRETLAPHTEVEREQLAVYFGEREHRVNWRIEYPVLLALLKVKAMSWAPHRQRSIEQDVLSDRQSLHGGDATNASATLDRSYGWANVLAIFYAQRFRSGHVTNYLLSALAVIMALMGLIVPSAKIFLVMAELGVIGLLFLNTSAGTKGEWHRRWLQYRHLAESLRPLAYLKRTGMISTPFRSDFIHGRSNREAGADWTRWYAAAVWRELDSPRGVMTPMRIRELAEDVVREQVVPQASYHQVNAERMQKLDHRLHEIGNFLMGAVIAACVLFIIGYGPLHHWIQSVMGFFIFATAGLPAVSAAVFGMRGHGEHLLAASRSANTVVALDANALRLQQASKLEPLAAALDNTAAIMLADLNEWSVAYSERSLEIPA
ncbi:MAG: hypothetical protein ABIO85_06310 [Sphingomicrobium sp.]